jgi:hypothetical protein
MKGDEPGTDAGPAFVGVCMGKYDHPARYEELPKASGLLQEIAAAFPGSQPIILNEPIGDLPGRLANALPDGALSGRPLIVVWSGHGVEGVGSSLQLIVRNTDEPTLNDTYQPAALAELAARTGASQILFVVDTCHAAAGILPIVAAAMTISDAAMKTEDKWVGILAASQSYGKARDGALLAHLRDLVKDGPKAPERRTIWSPYNRFVRGCEFVDALEAEWPGHDPQQRIHPATFGRSGEFIPNPCWIKNAPSELVAHLLLAARGADPGEEAWYFSGRSGPLSTLVGRVNARVPGLVVVTGPGGSGKSAVLGRVGALSDPAERARMRQHGVLPADGLDPGEGSVDANLNLRNMTPDAFIRDLGTRLGVPGASTIWALLDWAAGQDRTPVVLLDGLDEAGPEARRVAEEVVRLSQGCCVLVTTRRLESGVESWATTESLPRMLAGPSDVILDLADDDSEAVRAGLREYARKRLTGDVAAAALDVLADEVARIAGADGQGGTFLLARVLTTQVRENPGTDPADLARSLEHAFDEDLRRWPELTRNGTAIPGAARDLLFALAFAAGDGFPARDVWPLVASALSEPGTEYSEDDVHVLIGQYGEYYGRYIIAGSEDGQAVYRLYHRRLIDHLRGAFAIGDERAVRVHQALASLLTRQLGGDQ